MSSATEDATEIRRIIKELFTHTGEGDFVPSDAHEIVDEDLELYRKEHSLYAY